MKVTDAELTERAKALSPDFATRIVSYKGEIAQVKSATTDSVYTVRIHRLSDTELDVTCNCPARKLCHHVVEYYALRKGISPEMGAILDGDKSADEVDEVKETAPEPLTGRQMIASAIEQLVDGIGMLVNERMKKGGGY